MYQASVYPVSQTGGMGILLEAGAVAKNLTESQFGIASVKHRWESVRDIPAMPAPISVCGAGRKP